MSTALALALQAMLATVFPCAEVDAALAHDATNDVEPPWFALAETLTEHAPDLAQALRTQAAIDDRSMDDDKGRSARALLTQARQWFCARTMSDDEGALQVRLDEIFADPIFDGQREEESLWDRWINELKAWLASLLESEGMRQYAGASRVVYLGALALTLAYFAYRVLRRRRARLVQRTARTAPSAAATQTSSHELFSEADALLARGQLRAALAHAHRALVVTIGTSLPRGLSPGATNRQILAAVDERVREASIDAFMRFERNFFGPHVSRDEVERFLHQARDLCARVSVRHAHETEGVTA